MNKGKINGRLKEPKIKRTKGQKIFFAVIGVVLWMLAATYLVSFFITIINSFKDPFEYALGNTWRFPSSEYGWHFENYLAIFTEFQVNGVSFFGLFWNSLWQTLGTTCISVFCTVLASYAYTKYKFVGRSAVFFIVVMMMTLSLPGATHATYKMLNKMGLRNSYLFLLTSTNGFGAIFIIYMGYWKGIDFAYSEAAYIDGANEWQTLIHIMMPMMLPLMAVSLINQFVQGWLNENPSMLMLPDMPSLGYGLFLYQQKSSRSLNYPVFYAVLIVVSIPSMIVFALLHEKMIQLMDIGGGLKG